MQLTPFRNDRHCKHDSYKPTYCAEVVKSPDGKVFEVSPQSSDAINLKWTPFCKNEVIANYISLYPEVNEWGIQLLA